MSDPTGPHRPIESTIKRLEMIANTAPTITKGDHVFVSDLLDLIASHNAQRDSIAAADEVRRVLGVYVCWDQGEVCECHDCGNVRQVRPNLAEVSRAIIGFDAARSGKDEGSKP